MDTSEKIRKILDGRLENMSTGRSLSWWNYAAIGLWIAVDFVDSFKSLVDAITEEVEQAGQAANDIQKVLSRE